MLDYARSFGVPTAVMRMSCIYGPRQMGTEDQGWVAHFLIRALEGEPITIYGDGRQVRDMLDVGDAVEAYLLGLDRIDAVAGRAFNLGGGPANAVSLRQLLAHIEDLTGRPGRHPLLRLAGRRPALLRLRHAPGARASSGSVRRRPGARASPRLRAGSRTSAARRAGALRRSPRQRRPCRERLRRRPGGA